SSPSVAAQPHDVPAQDRPERIDLAGARGAHLVERHRARARAGRGVGLAPAALDGAAPLGHRRVTEALAHLERVVPAAELRPARPRLVAALAADAVGGAHALAAEPARGAVGAAAIGVGLVAVLDGVDAAVAVADALVVRAQSAATVARVEASLVGAAGV